MRQILAFCTILAIVMTVMTVSVAPAAMASEWKDGVLFNQKKLTTPKNTDPYQIEYGLKSKKCSGKITAVAEWLAMKKGTLTQVYEDGKSVERKVGDGWFHLKGTKLLKVCNNSDEEAILFGVQFK